MMAEIAPPLDAPEGEIIAWIIEPKKSLSVPYLTLKQDVAEKRLKAGDFVTPYVSKHVETTSEGDEL